MATYTKMALSFAVGDRQIPVTATIAPGTPLHIGVTGTAAHDEVWLYCCNNYGSQIYATVWWGGTGNGDMNVVPIPASVGRVILADGKLINSGGTIAVSCPANGTYGLVLDGFINRIQ